MEISQVNDYYRLRETPVHPAFSNLYYGRHTRSWFVLFDVIVNHYCVVISMQVIEGSSPVPPAGETEGAEPQGAEEDGPAADEEDTA